MWSPSLQMKSTLLCQGCQIHVKAVRESPLAADQSNHSLRHRDGEVRRLRQEIGRDLRPRFQRPGLLHVRLRHHEYRTRGAPPGGDLHVRQRRSSGERRRVRQEPVHVEA
jgi:hypothetical protein